MSVFVENFARIVGDLPDQVAEVARLAEAELTGASLLGTRRLQAMRRVRDQLAGPPLATSEVYHAPQYGLTDDQQAHFRTILERSHVNLVEPALDRLVNSIHAGRIQRRAEGALGEALRRPEHGSAMALLCENAFAYGTGALVPVRRDDGGVRYWLPDPLGLVVITDPADVYEVEGLVELSWTVVEDTRRAVVRGVTREWIGQSIEGVESDWRAHGLGMVPAVLAFGRDERHHGCKYGRSLVLGVADATIRVTNNEVNLELLRDRQTQALLVLQGEPNRTSTDDQGARNKYVQFPRDGGDARYETPESRIEDVISLTRRFCEDAAISSGLPLDTFLPSLIAGADASATAARIRAFPLQQRMMRLVRAWEIVESEAARLLGRVIGAEAGSVSVRITPSFPEAEAETLANWQQRMGAFLCRPEDAIEFYSEDLAPEEKAALAASWRLKNDPSVVNGQADEVAKFKREVVKALYSDATTGDVLANLTRLGDLVEEVGLPRQAGYEEPWLPVLAENGEAVSGDVVRDEAGDVVGGATIPTGVTREVTV